MADADGAGRRIGTYTMFTLRAYDLPLSHTDLGLSDKEAKILAGNPRVMYLLGYGYTQVIGDAATTIAKDLPEADKPAARTAKRQARHASILDGTFDQRRDRGPRRIGLDQCLFDAAVMALKAAQAKAGLPWPQGKGSSEAIRTAVEAYWSVERPGHTAVRQAAQMAYDAQNAMPDSEDLGDILSGLAIKPQADPKPQAE
jgi:hypothetical protein